MDVIVSNHLFGLDISHKAYLQIIIKYDFSSHKFIQFLEIKINII